MAETRSTILAPSIVVSDILRIGRHTPSLNRSDASPSFLQMRRTLARWAIAHTQTYVDAVVCIREAVVHIHSRGRGTSALAPVSITRRMTMRQMRVGKVRFKPTFVHAAVADLQYAGFCSASRLTRWRFVSASRAGASYGRPVISHPSSASRKYRRCDRRPAPTSSPQNLPDMVAHAVVPVCTSRRTPHTVLA